MNSDNMYWRQCYSFYRFRTFPVKTMFLEDLLSESSISLPRTRWSRLFPQDERIRFKQLRQNAVYAQLPTVYSDRVWHQLSKWDERDNHEVEISLVVDAIMHIHRTYPLDGGESAILVE